MSFLTSVQLILVIYLDYNSSFYSTFKLASNSAVLLRHCTLYKFTYGSYYIPIENYRLHLFFISQQSIGVSKNFPCFDAEMEEDGEGSELLSSLPKTTDCQCILYVL